MLYDTKDNSNQRDSIFSLFKRSKILTTSVRMYLFDSWLIYMTHDILNKAFWRALIVQDKQLISSLG